MHGGVGGAEEKGDGNRDLSVEESELVGSRRVFNVAVVVLGWGNESEGSLWDLISSRSKLGGGREGQSACSA